MLVSARALQSEEETAATADGLASLLGGDLELYRYAVADLVERYGDAYVRDAAFIISRLERFAARHGHTLPHVLRIYAEFAEQTVRDAQLFARTGRYRFTSEEEIEHIVGDETFQLEYLYVLTVSTPLNRSRYELFRHFRNTVGKHLGAGSRSLEIGGGNCLDSMFIADYGEVEVYEKNRKSLLWQEILGLSEKIDLKIEYYAFDDFKKYDFVCMIELLEHVSDPAGYLRGAQRVLKDEGCAYLTFAVRMPQLDHLYQFDSVGECQSLLEAAGFQIVEDYCTLNTHRPFGDEERWALADNPKLGVTYCCLVRKQTGRGVAELIDGFNDDLDL